MPAADLSSPPPVTDQMWAVLAIGLTILGTVLTLRGMRNRQAAVVRFVKTGRSVHASGRAEGSGSVKLATVIGGAERTLDERVAVLEVRSRQLEEALDEKAVEIVAVLRAQIAAIHADDVKEDQDRAERLKALVGELGTSREDALALASFFAAALAAAIPSFP